MSGLENPHDEVVLLQCNLDDMTGEALGFVLERVLAEGALDAWFVPIQMKKSRPGTTLSVLCRRKDAAALRKLLLRETTTLGVRWQVMQREIVQRQTVQVQTPWGSVRCKLKILEGSVKGAKPEFDDCARLAREHGLPVNDVIEAARDAGSRLLEENGS